jgi:hypothetical protein
MARNTNYYMNSCITSEYIDHEVFDIKHHGSDTKDGTQRYKGPHRALRCEVLDSSSELWPPANFLVLQWVAMGPHELATSTAVLKHFYSKKKIHKQVLSN